MTQERAGFTIWITGLPAAGKTTLAASVAHELESHGATVLLLDGDELRQRLSSDLGYDASSRAEQARRAAHLAVAAGQRGEVAVVALVSPYARDRRAAQAIHERDGIDFVEVYLATPLAECERRDPKGLYADARRGVIRHLTGLDDPYEPPRDPDLVLGADCEAVERDAVAVLRVLCERGLIASSVAAVPQPSTPGASPVDR